MAECIAKQHRLETGEVSNRWLQATFLWIVFEAFFQLPSLSVFHTLPELFEALHSYHAVFLSSSFSSASLFLAMVSRAFSTSDAVNRTYNNNI